MDYHITPLPDDILAIVRVSWYRDGRPDMINEVVLMEDGEDGYNAFSHVVATSVMQGANVSIRSTYRPEDLGLSS